MLRDERAFDELLDVACNHSAAAGSELLLRAARQVQDADRVSIAITAVLKDARTQAAKAVKAAQPTIEKLTAVMGELTELLGAVRDCRDARNVDHPEGRRGTLTYGEATEHKPDYDRTLLIRFFERVWNAQRQRSLDDLAVARLIGGHARWWDLALDAEKDTRTRDEVRRPLSEFAQWASRYQEEHPDEPRLGDWGDQLERTFGKSKRDPVPPPAGRRLSWFRRDITQ